LNTERWAFSFHPKKVPPPTPDGREGRLFPPEQSSKTLVLVIELTGRRNRILRELLQRIISLARNLSPNPASSGNSFERNWRLAVDDKEKNLCGI